MALTGGPANGSGRAERACNDPTLKAWLSSDLDGATMDTLAVQGVFNLLYALRDDVSRVRGMPVPSRMDP